MSNAMKVSTSTETTESRIPTFATVDEEAAFWDSHDITEFDDELEPVDDIVFGSIRSSRGLLLRLDGDVLEVLDRIADATGSDAPSVARRLIEEGIRQETERNPGLGS